MGDQATESQWSHLLGRCMQGPHEGKMLDPIPSVITDWATWKAEHPFTDIMDWPLQRNTKYNKALLDGKWNRYLIGMVDGKDSIGYAMDELQKQPLVNDEFGGHQHVIWFDTESHGAWVYDRQLEDRLLDFRMRGEQIIDIQTESTWNLMAGTADAGPLKGSRLSPLVSIPSLKHAWAAFHGDSTYWTITP